MNTEVELDLSRWREAFRHWPLYAALVGLLFITLVGVMGWRMTPLTPAGAPRFLTWDDWQAFHIRQQVARELAALRRESQALADLLQDTPDPVRAGLALTRIRQLTAGGQPILASQRQALLDAAQAVNAWAAGAETQADATAALQAVIRALAEPTVSPSQIPLAGPTEALISPTPVSPGEAVNPESREAWIH